MQQSPKKMMKIKFGTTLEVGSRKVVVGGDLEDEEDTDSENDDEAPLANNEAPKRQAQRQYRRNSKSEER